MSVACDEAYEVYNETVRRARKQHVCDACKTPPIAAGDFYARTFILFDGDARAVVRCLRCQQIHKHLRTLGDGEMWPDEKLDCGEEYREHWGKEPPPEIAALAFALPYELQNEFLMSRKAGR